MLVYSIVVNTRINKERYVYYGMILFSYLYRCSPGELWWLYFCRCLKTSGNQIRIKRVSLKLRYLIMSRLTRRSLVGHEPTILQEILGRFQEQILSVELTCFSICSTYLWSINYHFSKFSYNRSMFTITNYKKILRKGILKTFLNYFNISYSPKVHTLVCRGPK